MMAMAGADSGMCVFDLHVSSRAPRRAELLGAADAAA